ncbi:integrase, partial [Vibrio astriarenae]
ARKKAAELRKLKAQGKDLAVEQKKQKLEVKRQACNTVKKIAEMWLETASSRVVKKTAEGYRQKLNLHILPKIGDVPIHDVRAAMWIDAM